MATGSRSHNFWTTAPGMLTAFAGVITAVGALITVLLQTGLIGSTGTDPAPPPAAAQPQITTAPVTTAPVTSTASPSAASTPAAAEGKPWRDVEAVMTLKDRKVVRMRAETVRYCFSGGAGLFLDENQTVAFEKMTRIDVLRSDVALSSGGRATVRITLATGSTIEGTISSGCEIFGEPELGRFGVYSDRLLKIEFLR